MVSVVAAGWCGVVLKMIRFDCRVCDFSVKDNVYCVFWFVVTYCVAAHICAKLEFTWSARGDMTPIPYINPGNDETCIATFQKSFSSLCNLMMITLVTDDKVMTHVGVRT